MGLRRGHGKGKGALVRVEVLPPDELPSASAPIAVRADRGPDGRFRPGNAVGRTARLRPGPRGVAGIDTASPEFRTFLRWGRRYAAHRRAELARAHGGEVSAGVGAIVESAGQTLAASRYAQWRASQTGDVELFKTASALASTARQHELAAWELAAREAKVRASQPRSMEEFWAELSAERRGTL